MFGMAQAPQQAPPQTGGAAQSPLLRIRAGIESGSVAEVQAGVQEADINGVELAPNVRQMITQWLSVNAPGSATPAATPAASSPAPQAPAQSQQPNEDGVRQGEGTKGWETSVAPVREGGAAGAVDKNASLSPELMRLCLMKFFAGGPRGSDAAKGLGVIEKDNGDRFLPLPYVGKALGVKGEDFEIAMAVYGRVNAAPTGVFIMSDDARGVGLVEWAGWEMFGASLEAIVKGTQDPAFEPRSIQAAVASCAHGAVRSGIVRQAEVLDRLSSSLSPSSLPEDTAPALRSAGDSVESGDEAPDAVRIEGLQSTLLQLEAEPSALFATLLGGDPNWDGSCEALPIMTNSAGVDDLVLDEMLRYPWVSMSTRDSERIAFAKNFRPSPRLARYEWDGLPRTVFPHLWCGLATGPRRQPEEPEEPIEVFVPLVCDNVVHSFHVDRVLFRQDLINVPKIKS